MELQGAVSKILETADYSRSYKKICTIFASKQSFHSENQIFSASYNRAIEYGKENVPVNWVVFNQLVSSF